MGTRLGEVYSCCCLPLVPQLSSSILKTRGPLFSPALYNLKQKRRPRCPGSFPRKNARFLRDSFPFYTCTVGGGRRGAKERLRQKRHRSHLICFNAPEMTLRRRSVGRTFAFLRLPVRPSGNRLRMKSAPRDGDGDGGREDRGRRRERTDLFGS